MTGEIQQAGIRQRLSGLSNEAREQQLLQFVSLIFQENANNH